jgi:hypothetical protein
MKKEKKTTISSTQMFLDIVEIRDEVVILRDGTIRAVLLVSSINFALKGEDEQNAIIQAYVSFLNSLDYPLQIVIQSRKLDIDNYLEMLKTREKEQTNELLRMQISSYRKYIMELLELGEIMSKKFYVVVPYNPLSDKKKSFFSRTIEAFSAPKIIRIKTERFIHHRNELIQRVEFILSGLNSMSLSAVMLDTQGLIELYYNTYNPETSKQQKMADISKLRIEE